MKIVLAPDSFKGTLSSKRICEIISRELKSALPDCAVISVPLADGGEGTLDVIMNTLGGRYIKKEVCSPLSARVNAVFGVLADGTAIIETAAASGLPLVPQDMLDPLCATSYGTGELIRAALDLGCRSITLGLGGSATNDGGIGAMAALGAAFTDAQGNPVPFDGRGLSRIASLDVSALHPAIRETSFTVMCDVDNPLIGERGATYTFGPQKGANAETLTQLERGMQNYASLLQRQFSFDPDTPGAGAAGGLGAALMAFCRARPERGITAVLRLCGFDGLIRGADLVITGEGRADSQSAHGKVLWGVGHACMAQGVPAIAIAGCAGDGADELTECGIRRVYATLRSDMPLSYSMQHAEELLQATSSALFFTICKNGVSAVL